MNTLDWFKERDEHLAKSGIGEELKNKAIDSSSEKLWNKGTLSKFRKETGNNFSKKMTAGRKKEEIAKKMKH